MASGYGFIWMKNYFRCIKLIAPNAFQPDKSSMV